MDVKYNKRFEKLMGGAFSVASYEYIACNEMANLLNAPVVNKDGCNYLKSLVKEGTGFSKTFIDRTGNEAFYNKVVTLTYMKSIDPINEFYCGLAYAIDLAKKLDRNFNETFRVILSYNDADEEDVQLCTVRFYKERINEKWLLDDLEGYLSDSILAIITK